jgi:Predicted membrane protein (DUF2254)
VVTDQRPKTTEESRLRIRLVVRRWRLWWRYQLRRLRWRGPLRRLRLLREPGDEVALAKAQLWIGRRLGDIYLKFDRLKEWAKISWARLPDRAEPATTTAGLIRRQLPLLTGLLALILLGVGLDALAREGGRELVEAIEVDDWLRDTFTLPSEETLRNLLAASAAGTATVLGLVISISLITWQATADRYRSSTIVAFLLRDATGSAVVRLLALGFAYSLWVLAALELLGHPPYVSAAIALLICTAAILSLISYREVGLLGYLPARIANSLRRDAIREIKRAARKHAGRSVEAGSRRLVAGDVVIFEDLIRRLLREESTPDLAACVHQMGAVLAFYMTHKHSLEPRSLFFARREERLGPAALDIEESIVSEGLMNPTTEVPDHLWLEREILQALAAVADSEQIREPEVAEALSRVWGYALQYGWHLEDTEALNLVFEQVVKAFEHDAWRKERALAEGLMILPWLLVEAIGSGPQASAEEIVACEPWRGVERFSDLPWAAREDARELGERTEREIGIAGSVVTPGKVMVKEVEARREARLSVLREELIERVVALYRQALHAAAGEQSAGGGVIARMTLRALLRIDHYGLAVPDISASVTDFVAVVDFGSQEEIDDVRADAGRAARAFAMSKSWTAAAACLDVSAKLSLIASALESDQLKSTGLLFEMFYAAAAVWAWGEYHGHTMTAACGRYLQPPYANLDGLAELAKQRQLTTLSFPSVKIYGWFQPLRSAAHELSEVPVGDGGFGLRLKNNHPSPLFARAQINFGPKECLTGLIDATVAAREAGFREMRDALEALRRYREAAGN